MSSSRNCFSSLLRIVTKQYDGLTLVGQPRPSHLQSHQPRLYSQSSSKRPPTSFLLFYRDKLPEIKQKHGDSPNKVTLWSKTAGVMWKELDDSSRKHYQDLFESQKKEYLSNVTQSELDEEKKLLLDKKIKNKKRRERQEAKGLNKPKRPPTSHGLYIREMISSQLGDKDMKPFFKKLCEDWMNLSESEKARFVNNAAELRTAYERELSKWEDEQIDNGRNHLVRVSRLKDLKLLKPKKASAKKTKDLD